MGHDEHVTDPTTGSSLVELATRRIDRRTLLAGGASVALGAALGALWPAGIATGQGAPALLGFRPVPVSTADAVVVPEGYGAEVLYAWGDPISAGPRFRADAGNTAAEQEQQAGMHHDGMHFFPLPLGSGSSQRGLLALNHEYTDDGLLHPGGMEPWTADKVAKSQAAHGVSVVEVALSGGRWSVVRPSPYARRITARTACLVDGPAAGHTLLQTAADPSGRKVLGTFANCAHGVTPWGTYLTAEENFHFYFASARAGGPAREKRYGLGERSGYRWHEHDARFDVAQHPNEANRFGWIVEIDPFEPQREPVKHTALGRFKHESAAVTVAPDGRVVVYMGDDEAGEYLYKFVSARAFRPDDRAASRRLLEDGILHVAHFEADGRGEWIPLVHGARGLDAAAGFDSQAHVLVDARGAADRVGATRLDRPEWIAIHPRTGEVYCTLTNNVRRGKDPDQPVDAVNPRADNVFGHIVRWREPNGDPAATRFTWDILALAGDPQHPDPAKRGTVKGDAFGAPDGLWIDPRGVLWIQTDVAARDVNKGDYARLGNNQMLAADPGSGEVRRFLTGPAGCELTGMISTPDGTTLFVNIQHPGETASNRSDPARPQELSTWPDGPTGGRPRSATLAIRRRDGGVVGA